MSSQWNAQQPARNSSASVDFLRSHILTRHKDTVLCMDVSLVHKDRVDDEFYAKHGLHLLFTGGQDHCIRIWDMQFGSCVAAVLAHRRSISCVLALPHPWSDYLLSLSYDRTMKIWRISDLLRGSPGFSRERIERGFMRMSWSGGVDSVSVDVGTGHLESKAVGDSPSVVAPVCTVSSLPTAALSAVLLPLRTSGPTRPQDAPPVLSVALGLQTGEVAVLSLSGLLSYCLHPDREGGAVSLCFETLRDPQFQFPKAHAPVFGSRQTGPSPQQIEAMRTLCAEVNAHCRASQGCEAVSQQQRIHMSPVYAMAAVTSNGMPRDSLLVTGGSNGDVLVHAVQACVCESSSAEEGKPCACVTRLRMVQELSGDSKPVTHLALSPDLLSRCQPWGRQGSHESKQPATGPSPSHLRKQPDRVSLFCANEDATIRCFAVSAVDARFYYVRSVDCRTALSSLMSHLGPSRWEDGGGSPGVTDQDAMEVTITTMHATSQFLYATVAVRFQAKGNSSSGSLEQRVRNARLISLVGSYLLVYAIREGAVSCVQVVRVNPYRDNPHVPSLHGLDWPQDDDSSASVGASQGELSAPQGPAGAAIISMVAHHVVRQMYSRYTEQAKDGADVVSMETLAQALARVVCERTASGCHSLPFELQAGLPPCFSAAILNRSAAPSLHSSPSLPLGNSPATDSRALMGLEKARDRSSFARALSSLGHDRGESIPSSPPPITHAGVVDKGTSLLRVMSSESLDTALSGSEVGVARDSVVRAGGDSAVLGGSAGAGAGAADGESKGRLSGRQQSHRLHTDFRVTSLASDSHHLYLGCTDSGVQVFTHILRDDSSDGYVWGLLGGSFDQRLEAAVRQSCEHPAKPTVSSATGDGSTALTNPTTLSAGSTGDAPSTETVPTTVSVTTETAPSAPVLEPASLHDFLLYADSLSASTDSGDTKDRCVSYANLLYGTHGLNVDSLLMCSEADIRQEIPGLPLGPRKKLVRAIAAGFSAFAQWRREHPDQLSSGGGVTSERPVRGSADLTQVIARADVQRLLCVAAPVVLHHLWNMARLSETTRMVESLRLMCACPSVSSIDWRQWAALNHPRLSPRFVPPCDRMAFQLYRFMSLFASECRQVHGKAGKNPVIFGRFNGTLPVNGKATVTTPSTPGEAKTRTDRKRRRHTKIVYVGHYDVVSGGTGEWHSNPFELVARNGYLYGRGSTDDKGPILAALYALWELMHYRTPLDESADCQHGTEAKGSEPSTSTQDGRDEVASWEVVVILEGEEETGSFAGGFKHAVLQNKDWFTDVDVILMANSYWLGDSLPCLVYGMRGLVKMDLTVWGPRRDLHSGVHGGAIVDPMTDLVRLVTSFTDTQSTSSTTSQIPHKTSHSPSPKNESDTLSQTDGELPISSVSSEVSVPEDSRTVRIPGFYNQVAPLSAEILRKYFDKLLFDLKAYERWMGVSTRRQDSAALVSAVSTSSDERTDPDHTHSCDHGGHSHGSAHSLLYDLWCVPSLTVHSIKAVPLQDSSWRALKELHRCVCPDSETVKDTGRGGHGHGGPPPRKHTPGSSATVDESRLIGNAGWAQQSSSFGDSGPSADVPGRPACSLALEQRAGCVQGLSGFSTAMCKAVRAEISVRTVPNQRPQDVFRAFADYIHTWWARSCASGSLQSPDERKTETSEGVYEPDRDQPLLTSCACTRSCVKPKEDSDDSDSLSQGQCHVCRPGGGSSTAGCSCRACGGGNHYHLAKTSEGSWWLGDPENVYFQRAAAAIRDVWGVDAQFVREGGTLHMTRWLHETLGAPCVLVPIGQGSDQAHMPDERIRLQNLVNGKEVIKQFIRRCLMD